jgi:hypothetical protein
MFRVQEELNDFFKENKEKIPQCFGNSNLSTMYQQL